MTKCVALIDPTILPVGVDYLKSRASVTLAPDGNEKTLIQTIQDAQAQALIVRVEDATRTIFEQCSSLCVVGMHGVGTDTIDIEAATDHGILVLHTPWVNYKSTSEHALALLMSVAKKIMPGHQAVKDGKFVYYRNNHLPMELEGKTVFIIGVGRIGGEMARKCKAAFNMRVLGHDPAYTSDELAQKGVEKVSLEDGLRQADFVSIHTPLNPTTRLIMNEHTFSLMKKGASFINASRGGTMDQSALLAALDSGHLFGAGLDVFNPEPVPLNDPVTVHEKVVLSPHFAGDTNEARSRCSETIAKAIIDVLDGLPVEGIVNPDVLTRANYRLGRLLAA
ncbi:hydroxyacid dehydrogenase [Brucella haematophila]|uniref:hydroxyacid dehydrogenase n=1 Tax=Brucella haematophila TaxID=419474 RepID=UPI00110E382F|nr:hydroxyacid dehydrogenase [Brucella haematophila]TMU95463.1 hydroxyacid dehydrogenase [Brucella haematophila]